MLSFIKRIPYIPDTIPFCPDVINTIILLKRAFIRHESKLAKFQKWRLIGTSDKCGFGGKVKKFVVRVLTVSPRLRPQ